VTTRRGVTWTVEEPDSCGGFWEPWWEKGWEDDTLDVVERFCRPDATFVDLGAWIGPISMWAARLGPVLAVEPDPVACRYLKRNRDTNGYRFQIVRGAVAWATGPLEIAPSADGWGSSMTRVGPGPKAWGWTLPDLLARTQTGRVSLVKMDIEGFEVDVLPHVGPYLAKRGVPLFVAIHEPYWNRPLDPAALTGFEHVEGKLEGFGHVLCY
jgi:FkbM family methyltransferase